MFGVRLPVNFDSPYKAASLIEFWRRWHMTLSRFLRDYVYVPLGGNRHGKATQLLAVLATMVLGGLWHGAAWTFVAWGAFHGALLCVNHAWRSMRARAPLSELQIWGNRILVFLAVVVGWVLFRADSLHAATGVLRGMAGINEWGPVDRLLAIKLAG